MSACGAIAENTDSRALLVEITRDPLMLIFLDGTINIASAPNENYARELLELFTMGPANLNGDPNYTEEGGDITEISKALTGWITTELDIPGTNRKELDGDF